MEEINLIREMRGCPAKKARDWYNRCKGDVMLAVGWKKELKILAEWVEQFDI